ncbi:Uncharacterised protein [Zhongshania aliphaticivorans]|uniref:Uncharacterized protein n=1 Tax=Zhongshania aliphaticivorans TaxID=1470434 RepID=A0A5S9MQC3_9GAMM|nr:hypothetical protein [Zhongshania aliphaticivorans]CAA0079254.1 Uncharacterised protein [Zhongshania aliphaticivorans]CAA0086289.1 Uncharacterised protein [Zhongshania aliphaticivorans]
MTHLQEVVQNQDPSVIAELAAKYSLLAIVAVGIAACFVSLV